MSTYLGYSRPCSPLKETFSAFEEKQHYLPLSPLDTTSTESSSPPTSHYDDNTFVLKDEPNDLFSSYLQMPSEIDSKEKQDSKSLLKIKVLGIPETGAKSRVETQIKLSIQLEDDENNKITDYSFIRLQNQMLARSRLKKLQQQNNGAVIVADSQVLDLEAKVITSRTEQPIRMCVGCVQRERKRAERTKDKSSVDELQTTIEEERDRILIFNCNPMINFNSGDAILPTRITCYCRHHDEKLGFRVCFVMRNDKGEMVASGMSAPILITDDHKSSKKKKDINNDTNRKRTRSIDNNSVQESPETPLDTPKSEKKDMILDQDDMATLFQQQEEGWPSHQRRRTDTQGHFVPVSLPTTPLTEKDDFSLLSDFAAAFNANTNGMLPFASSATFIPPSASVQPLSLSASSSLPRQSNSSSTTSISSSSSSLSLSSLSSSAMLPLQPIPTTVSSSSAIPTTGIDPAPFLPILNEPMMPPPPPQARMPQIDRLVPSQGPIYGGTEVSILGSGFYQGLCCVFGEQSAATLYWSENTMVCLLPPASTPGPVVVSFKEQILEQSEICIFTYYDASDQALLELALQLVGMKSTGKLQDAKQVAMGIIVEGKSIQTGNSQGHTMLHLLVLLKHIDLLKSWIEHKHALDMQDTSGMTALHLACHLGSLEMVTLLTEAGADTTIKNKDGYLASFFIPHDHHDIKTLLPSPKRKPLSRRSSMKGTHLTHRFHSLTKETEVEETMAPTMESDGLGFVQPKLDKRLYLFWLPVLIVAVGLLFVQLIGHPTLLEPLLEKVPRRLSFTI